MMGSKIWILAIFQVLCITFSSGVQVPTPPPVSSFIKQFFDEVKSSKTLTNLFNLGDDISPDELAAGIFYGATVYGITRGDSNSALHAHEATRYIADSFDELTYPLLVREFSGSLSKYVYLVGKLNNDNAKSMAKELAKVLSDWCDKSVDDRYPRSKVTAWTIGFEDWLANLGLFTKDRVGAIRKTFGDEWLYLASNLTDALPKKPSHCLTEKSIRKGSQSSDLKPSEDSCFNVTPEVAAFRNALIHAVLSSEELRSGFDFGKVSPLEYNRAVFYTAQYIFARVGSKDSASQAQFMSKYIGKLDDVKLPRLLRVAGNIVGKYLQATDGLTMDNASDLAEKFSKAAEDILYKYLDINDTKAKIPVLSYGLAKFLVSEGLLGPNDVGDLAFYFGNEWFCENRRQEKRKCQ